MTEGNATQSPAVDNSTKTLSQTQFLSSFLNKIVKSSLIRSAGVYVGFRILDRIVPFLLLPIVTRYLLPEEYGIYIIFQALVGFVLPLVTLNSDSAILLNYFHLIKEQFKIYFSNGFLIFIAALIITSSVIFLSASNISSLVNFPGSWLLAVPLVCAFQYFTKLALNLWQVRKEPFKYGIFMISLTLFKNALMIYFVVFLDYKWEGLVVSQLIGWAVFSIVSIIVFVRNKLFVFKFSEDYLRDNLKVGSPLSLHQLGSWLGSISARLILSSLLGTAVTGHFGVGCTFGMIVSLVHTAFNNAYVPYLFEKLNKLTDEIEFNLVKLTYLYNAVLLLFAILLGFLGYIFTGLIFGAQYENAKVFVIWISLGYAFDGMYKMHVNYIFYKKKTYLIFLITVTSGVLNVCLCYLLVKSNGAIGAAQALCVNYFISYILSWYISNKIIRMPWFKIKSIFRIS